ncbi:MAG TPA: pyridoxal phosphate-dependent aminotransferase family protein [Chitinophagaceae bacterium]|nr:pyridoxal phosphate-dependent aminotransferase family protein [Chitinophagaceae bacterium]
MQTSYTDLKEIQVQGRRKGLRTRTSEFLAITKSIAHTYFREVISPMDREVLVRDQHTGKVSNMLMFASNNYLGFANHPYIRERVKQSIDEYGCGVGGPPLLNGYHKLIREAEERLAAWKKQEDAIIFSSGFCTNLGIITGLTHSGDLVVFDELSHASFYDGIKYSHAQSISFTHNCMDEFGSILDKHQAKNGQTVFASVEGVYSMDGDCAPLKQFSSICREYGAVSVVDDAHGSGVLGETGAGTAEAFGCTDDIDIHMGTFSKAFAVSGGFAAASKDIINYLRYYARPYFFSASFPPSTAAAVIAALDLLENEPWRRKRLLNNVAYTSSLIEHLGLYARAEAGFLTLKVPRGMNMRKAAMEFHKRKIFLNAIEYPAVPFDKQRFRISLMADHTREDIHRLVQAIEEIWATDEMFML